MSTDLDFLKTIGLDQHLSVTRKNGLSSMIDRIKLEAKKISNWGNNLLGKILNITSLQIHPAGREIRRVNKNLLGLMV